jgi:FKBP-type peptidyl-prolyl cis-trans isomerase SlyD
MVISKDSVVSVTYELKIANGDGDIVEKVNDNNPLIFLLGHGNLLPMFETYLSGLKTGDPFDFMLNSEEAYGKISQEAIVDLPKSTFVVDGEIDSELLKVGNIIPMTDQSGNRFNGKVLEYEGENITMDFNHPLAGEDLHFKGQVVGVREATDEELQHGHLHQSHGCGSCGPESGSECGSGGCGSGCGCGSN